MLRHDALASLADTFRRFAANETRENLSPLYERLSLFVAGDAALLDLASHAMPGQPTPNMLFAAVQFVLGDNAPDPLAAWYPSVSGGPVAAGDPGPAFRAFALAHRAEISALLKSRMVQTNEVRRSALLFPALVEVHRARRRPLALVEIGASAGLNLLFDRYRYRYGPLETGLSSASVVLDCLPEGELPPVDSGFPPVASRLGIDLRPVNVANHGDVRWLRALVWPEHDDRRALLNAAIAVAKADPPLILAGDALDLLPAAVRAAPTEAAACLVATFVLNQFPPQKVQRLAALLASLSHEREISLVTLGWNPLVSPHDAAATSWTSLWLVGYRGGDRTVRHLARCNPHGRHIAWGAPAPA